MSTKKSRKRWLTVLYVVMWIGALWTGLAFLGYLSTVIERWHNYSADRSSAIAALLAEIVVGFMAALFIVATVVMRKARKKRFEHAVIRTQL